MMLIVHKQSNGKLKLDHILITLEIMR